MGGQQLLQQPVISPPEPPGARFSDFRANVEHPGVSVANFQPHICDLHTWEDPKNPWPASNCKITFLPLSSGPMLNTLGLVLPTFNHIFVIYTLGRILKVYGRPLIFLSIFAPPLQMQC